MLVHCFLHLLERDLSPHLLHRNQYVFSANKSRVISVKLPEYRLYFQLQLLFVLAGIKIHGCCQKVTVIYFSLSLAVEFFNNIIDSLL